MSKPSDLTNKSDYIPWVNGLKGLACLGVFLHHYFLAHRNGAVFGPLMDAGKERIASKTEIFLASNTAGFFINGNYHVTVFLLISAFLLARQIFLLTAKEDNITNKLSNIAIKRYFRLLIPVGFFSILNWVLIKVLTFSGLNYVHKATELNFKDLLVHIFVGVWSSEDALLLGPLWMMNYLFAGSFIAMLLAIMAGKDRKFMWLFYGLVTIYFYYANAYFFVTALGVDLAYLTCRTSFSSKVDAMKGVPKYIIGILLLGISIFLGGYPTHFVDNNIYAKFNGIRDAKPMIYVILHGLGAFFLVVSIYFLKPLSKLLSSKVFNFFGNISMGVYLIHIMVIEYFSYFFNDVLKNSMSYIPAFWLSFTVTCVITILLAFISSKTIEKGGEKLIKKIFH